MKTHFFSAELLLPEKLETVFQFFSDAHNLQAITPPWLSFNVLTPPPIAMRAGTLIDYRLRVHGLPMSWRSEITKWEPPHRFVDEQRRGPYRCWIHEHTFAAKDGGTLCGDRVEYAVPGGSLVNWLWVRRDVEKIFQFRQRRLAEIFHAAKK